MSEERAATSAKMRLPASVRHYSETTAAAVIFVLLAVLPILVSGYSIYILPQYLLYGMLAMSLWHSLGIHRDPELWPSGVLRARRLRNGARGEMGVWRQPGLHSPCREPSHRRQAWRPQSDISCSASECGTCILSW